MKKVPKAQKNSPFDRRSQFPEGCTCLDYSYLKERRDRPLCPVHKIPDRTAQQIFDEAKEK